jgi:hypothetical protein
MVRVGLHVLLLVVAMGGASACGQQDQLKSQSIQNKQGGPSAGVRALAAPGSTHRSAGIMPKRDSDQSQPVGAVPAAASKPANIPYLGGAVLPNPTVYALWWGDPADFP